MDFTRRVLEGHVVLDLGDPSAGPLDLDTKALTIGSIRTESGADVRWEMGPEEEILGRRLRLTLPAGTQRVRIDYATSPEAIALQWLDPVQTSGKRQPFLFSQCQAIHARTMVPVQDSPRVRMSYRAEVTVPEALGAVMSAGPAGSRPGPGPGTRTLVFEMPQPIPAYLLALFARVI